MSTAMAVNNDEQPLQNLLSYPPFIWEAISVDGVTYPFSTNRFNMTEKQRAENIGMVNEYDNAVAIRIGELVVAGDDAELGQLVREQILGHAKQVLEAA